MKKLLFFLITFIACGYAFGQDVIVKKDGTTVLCKIVQANNSEVIYLKWSDLDGPQYIMDSSLVSNINYQDGRQDKLNEQTSNNYAPGIQQTGEAQYNDNALYKLDLTRNKNDYRKKAKNLTIVGWTVGGTCVAAGTFLLIISHIWELDLIGGLLIAGGVTTTTGCLIKAYQYNHKIKELSFYNIYQHNVNFGDGSSLSAGIDIIHNKYTHGFTPGIGLQFNF